MERLRELLLARGAAQVGFADLGELYPEVRYHLPRGISIAVALDPHIISNIAAGPTPQYYDEYVRVNQQLNDLATLAADFLKGLGFRVKAVESTVAYVDPGTCSAPFQHKTVATRAGLGWIGKGALLITRQYGSAVRLSSVLTDAPLSVGRPTNHSHCGECHACVEACPGGAIKGASWRVGMFRDELYDASVCRETCLKLAGRVGVNRTVCGICINVCPWTRRYLAPAMAGAETAK
jgi:epoxyqueuosine reductase